MITQTLYPLSGTAYRYAAHLQHPPFARGNTYCVIATLVALSHPRNLAGDVPLLSAWGKHEYDARENLEGKLRAWLAPPPPPLP